MGSTPTPITLVAFVVAVTTGASAQQPRPTRPSAPAAAQRQAPGPERPGTGYVAISAGIYYSCALQADGSAWCWGSNQTGQLGAGAADTIPRTTPQRVPGDQRWSAISAGAMMEFGLATTCAFDQGGGVWCWGSNRWRQAGQSGSDARALYAEPVRVQGAPELARAVATSGMLSCTLDSAGAAWCWGDNAHGKAGTITEISFVERPSKPVGSERLGFVAITTGGTHTCLVSRQGPSWCVGSNSQGQLGLGQDAGSGMMRMGFSAVDSVAGVRFVALSAGGVHTCGLTSGGLAYCWGYNRYGQLGIGGPDTLPHAAPAPVAGGRTFASLSAGAYHTCGVTPTGEAFCWGRNLHGRLGDSTATDAGEPRPVAGGHRFYSVSAGYNHTCGVTTAGAALCWGDNGSGALGSGTREGSPVPVRVASP